MVSKLKHGKGVPLGPTVGQFDPYAGDTFESISAQQADFLESCFNSIDTQQMTTMENMANSRL